MDDWSLGMKLRKARKSKGLTLRELAKKSGVDCNAIWSWENGRSEPPFFQLSRVAQVLNIRLDYLATTDPRPLSPDEIRQSHDVPVYLVTIYGVRQWMIRYEDGFADTFGDWVALADMNWEEYDKTWVMYGYKP